ncbi:MAG: hypothetical protein JW720_01860 [Sedimentisphaerales bacterium]|nr:hypothetical protein [Sedimentisphaerales bacterium]
MYEKRVRILVITSSVLLAICILRLGQMQLFPGSSLQDDIARLRKQGNSSRQLKTVRGLILDRKGRALATDVVRFQLCIKYELCSILDENVRKASLLRAASNSDDEAANKALVAARGKLEAKLATMQQIIDKLALFGAEREDIERDIREINERIWKLRTFLAWRRGEPNPELIRRYGKISSVPLSEAIDDFEKQVPSESRRLVLTSRVSNLPEMNKAIPIVEIEDDDEVFNAQVEFMNVDGIKILPREDRFYPYGSAAAQTIGWVGPASRPEDLEVFADDKLASYLSGELCGREDGVEYVCEAILRGRRGELLYDIDKQLVSETETQLGRDVRLTIDIELQKRIEDYLAGYEYDPNCGPGVAAVLIDVASGDVLVMASLPTFDLNRVRYDYGELSTDDINKPLINRAINKWYPPGSVVKPLIFVAGAQSGVISPDEVISCPAKAAPEGWPNCWIYNTYHWMGHDNQWPNNNARNAIKGSCNIYFSRLADRIDPPILQQWLFEFGYGRSIVPGPAHLEDSEFERSFRHLSGRISSGVPKGRIVRFDQVPLLTKQERRWFGIGHGKLLVTPLQVANAMAALARGGKYKSPQLFLDDPNGPSRRIRVDCNETDLMLSEEVLATVYDGMWAVVNETSGTANKQFAGVLGRLAEQDVKVYGKTGSTESPDHAWFGGFGKDSEGRAIAIALVVEGGQHGSSDAAPLARDIIQFSIEAGYLGKAIADTE